MSNGILAVWTDVATEAEADFNEWYIRQHVEERVDVPGFLTGCRYTATAGKPRYLAIYETQSPEVLTGPDYMERLNEPTEWTSRVMPAFRNLIRTICRVRARRGIGRGGFVGTVRLEPAPGAERKLETWISRNLLDTLLGRPGIVRAEFWQAENLKPLDETAEQRLRGGEDASARWVVQFDGMDESSIHSAMTEVLSSQALEAEGAERGSEAGIYQLAYAAQNVT
ncbi:MAG: hypothetical protein QF893_21200 [Alphaproteobacteria bacterium]|jgi:hypothetical protein|nr:hypothetical protein [Alphaproteobacteria bacterium]